MQEAVGSASKFFKQIFTKKTKLKDEFKMGFGIRHARDELWYKKAITKTEKKWRTTEKWRTRRHEIIKEFFEVHQTKDGMVSTDGIEPSTT